ncbi:MAG: leucyl/phenylalanyl-tRNA--protein transferase [Rhodobacteraceae bacterium]|nr:leucyl/phenylalanyl-tRNA--protein transferase [Paracoccaceae bacterium]
MHPQITPQILLRAYAAGVFPMAQSRHDRAIYWMDPKFRGILPIGGLHLSRSLRRKLRAEPFEIRVNTDFEGVLQGCADRPETWINAQIHDLYMALHHEGHAHSLETWAEGRLVGGIYGVTLGAAFFGESMFSRRRDASKVALAHLMARLAQGGYTLFDTQFVTDHLIGMGAREIPREEYRRLLARSMTRQADPFAQFAPLSGEEAIHWSSQTS